MTFHAVLYVIKIDKTVQWKITIFPREFVDILKAVKNALIEVWCKKISDKIHKLKFKKNQNLDGFQHSYRIP